MTYATVNPDWPRLVDFSDDPWDDAKLGEVEAYLDRLIESKQVRGANRLAHKFA